MYKFIKIFNYLVLLIVILVTLYSIFLFIQNRDVSILIFMLIGLIITSLLVYYLFHECFVITIDNDGIKIERHLLGKNKYVRWEEIKIVKSYFSGIRLYYDDEWIEIGVLSKGYLKLRDILIKKKYI